jgi:hypothetical protein
LRPAADGAARSAGDRAGELRRAQRQLDIEALVRGIEPGETDFRMNEERKIEVEEVESVAPPPRARVPECAPSEKLARKRDYLAGFLAGETESEPAAPGDSEELKESVVEALKSASTTRKSRSTSTSSGLIYDVEVTEDGDARVTMT